MDLTIIKEQEVLGRCFRIYGTPEEPLFLARDVAEWIEYGKTGNGDYDVSSMLQTIDEDEKVKIYGTINSRKPLESIGIANRMFVTEEGLYEVLMQSRKPIAKEFKKEVKKVLKQIRITGGYIPIKQEDDDLTILSKAIMISQKTIESKDKLISQQQLDISHKESVIIGLVDEIDLAEKRQILNQVMRNKGEDYQKRWNLLYSHFEMKYHINLRVRLDNYNNSHSPKLKNKLEYIDKVLNKIPELYEISAKLFENDVKSLASEIYNLC